MTNNPTRQQIIDAHNALEDLKNVAFNAAHFCSDTVLYAQWKKQILEALPPKPQPTMADVEWDDDKHYLAEAEHSFFGKVIMLGEGPLSGCIRITSVKDESVSKMPMLWQIAEPESLTPTGKRYTLKEEQNNDH